jgi:hypothetical protein
MVKKTLWDQTVADNVYQTTERDSSGQGCDDVCKRDLYCSLLHSQMDKIMDCRGKTFDREYLFEYLLSTVSNPWLP